MSGNGIPPGMTAADQLRAEANDRLDQLLKLVERIETNPALAGTDPFMVTVHALQRTMDTGGDLNTVIDVLAAACLRLYGDGAQR